MTKAFEVKAKEWDDNHEEHLKFIQENYTRQISKKDDQCQYLLSEKAMSVANLE
jgi:hypothetical protein